MKPARSVHFNPPSGKRRVRSVLRVGSQTSAVLATVRIARSVNTITEPVRQRVSIALDCSFSLIKDQKIAAPALTASIIVLRSD